VRGLICTTFSTSDLYLSLEGRLQWHIGDQLALVGHCLGNLFEKGDEVGDLEGVEDL
jgi:hypothetical protein